MGGGASRRPREVHDLDYERYLKYTEGCLPEEAKARLIDDLNRGTTIKEWYALMKERYGTAVQEVINATIIRVQEASYQMALAHHLEYKQRHLITLKVHRDDVLYYLFMDYFIANWHSIDHTGYLRTHTKLDPSFDKEEYLFSSNAAEALVHSTGHYDKYTWRRTRLIHELSFLLFNEPLVVNQGSRNTALNTGFVHVQGIGMVDTQRVKIDADNMSINGVQVADVYVFNQAMIDITRTNVRETILQGGGAGGAGGLPAAGPRYENPARALVPSPPPDFSLSSNDNPIRIVEAKPHIQTNEYYDGNTVWCGGNKKIVHISKEGDIHLRCPTCYPTRKGGVVMCKTCFTETEDYTRCITCRKIMCESCAPPTYDSESKGYYYKYKYVCSRACLDQTNQLEHTITNNMGRLHIAGVGEINAAAAVIDASEQTINGIRIDDLAEFNKAVELISEDQAGSKRKRSEAAKKAAETRKRNKEDKEKEEEDKPVVESAINNTTSRVIYKGAPAIMKYVPNEYLPFYKIESPHLPKVYQIIGNSVIMEVLDPFVFDEKQVPKYFDALKEVYRLTKFVQMDLSPANTMMHNGTIVFIDLWTTGSTPYYWIERPKEDPLPNLMRSLALVLIDFQYEKEAKQWRWDMIDEIKKVFPTASKAYLNAGIDHGIWEHARGAEAADRGGFYVLRAVYMMFIRTNKLQSYLQQEKKTFEDMIFAVTGYEDKEYAKYYNKTKMETGYLETDVFLKAFFEHIKANPDDNTVVKQLKINNINLL